MIKPRAERPSGSRFPEARFCDVRVLLSAAVRKRCVCVSALWSSGKRLRA